MAAATVTHHVKPVILAVAALIGLTCAYTWPLALHMATAVPHDRGDPLLVTWILWWSTRAIPLTTSWWNAPAFFPSTGILGFSENLLSLVPIAAPVFALTKTPLVAYNVLFMLSFVLCGLGAYFLGLTLTSRHDAAFLAAVAFAFAPYRLSHLNHLQLLSSYWMPVSLGALHLYASGKRPASAAIFAAAWLLQALASGYYMFFLSLLVGLWLVWFGAGLGRRKLLVLAGCWLAALVLMTPLLLGYRAIHERYGLKRSPVEIAYYSADIAGIASASEDSLMWGRLHAIHQSESEMFPGVTIVLLVAAGWVMMCRGRRITKVFVFYSAAATLMWILTLGPSPSLLGRSLGIAGPYRLLMSLPGFDEMRVPARLWMLSVLCLAAAGALVVAYIDNARTRRLVVILGIVGLVLDGWPRSFTLAAAPDLRPPAGNGTVARLGLPLAANETESMYRTIGDGLPVFNGYSGYEAPQHPALRDLLDRRDPEILQRLASAGPIQIVVEHALDADGSWRRYVESAGARRLDGGMDWTRYELRIRPLPPSFVGSGRSVPIVRVDANVNPSDINAVIDNDLNTRWHAAEPRGTEMVTVDLGTSQPVSAVVFLLGSYTSQYPRALEVESSQDGVGWLQEWSGRTALLAYDAAVREPRAVPLAVPLKGPARWIRVRQTSAEATRGWTIVELRVMQ
jgi:hypothetical protein